MPLLLPTTEPNTTSAPAKQGIIPIQQITHELVHQRRTTRIFLFLRHSVHPSTKNTSSDVLKYAFQYRTTLRSDVALAVVHSQKEPSDGGFTGQERANDERNFVNGEEGGDLGEPRGRGW